MAEEIFDIVDENGQPTGETVTRSQAHAEGIRHRTAHQVNPDNLQFAGTFLIQYEKEFHASHSRTMKLHSSMSMMRR